MKKLFHLFYGAFSRIYLLIFARPSAQKFNNLVLNLAFRARGYNNHGNLSSTGEKIFIELLASMKPRLCIDVGANKGEYSGELLKATGAHVIAFEPLPKAFSILKKLSDTYPDRFAPENFGVGKENATLDLFYGEADSELASFSPDVNQIPYVAASNTNKMSVPVITLDSYLNKIPDNFECIDLLKIDTEGFEYEVLSGAQKAIEKLKPKFIHIEYNWHQLFRTQSLKSLSSLMPGYKAYQLLPYGEGLVLRDVDLPESNIYHYSNFVFVRPDVTWS